MVNVIIKSDERREAERYTASRFGVGRNATPEQREAIETISRRSEEAVERGRTMERRYTR